MASIFTLDSTTIDPSAPTYEPAAALEPQGVSEHAQARSIGHASQRHSPNTTFSVSPATPVSSVSRLQGPQLNSADSSDTADERGIYSGSPRPSTPLSRHTPTNRNRSTEPVYQETAYPSTSLYRRQRSHSEEDRARKRIRLDDLSGAHCGIIFSVNVLIHLFDCTHVKNI